MWQRLQMTTLPLAKGNFLIIGGLLLINFIFNIVGNAGFKLSAQAPSWKGLLAWQVVGNLAGLITVLALTGMLKYLPLHVAQPMTQGLAIIGVQIVAAKLFFRESISPAQWIGMLLIIAGIIVIQRK